MKELINKGYNFSITNNIITAKLNNAVNGLNLIAVVSAGTHSYAASVAKPTSGISFNNPLEAELNLADCKAASITKIDLFAVSNANPAGDIELEIICAANDSKSMSLVNSSTSASFLGRVYLHNDAWKAKNMIDSVVGGIDGIHALFGNAAITNEIKLAFASQVQQSPQAQNNGIISMSTPTNTNSQQSIQMSTPSTVNNAPSSVSGNGARPGFGRNTRIGGYTIDQEKVSDALNNAVTQGKGLLNKLVSFSTQKSREAADEVNRLRSKKLLMGCIAAGAYLAYADGEATASELRNLLTSLENHEYLKLFDHKDIVDCFNSYIDTFKSDFDEGEIYVFETLTELKGKVDEGNIIIAIAMAVANEDNILTNEEERALKRIRLIMDI
ncbi:TerB family tellurite resistance protein [Vibrio splendidus]|nr:TerB family tellurite resistance protein [Vibrio splendidus]MCC4883093.1 TerB family tellurite resistance protein [Vibrio splendidus]